MATSQWPIVMDKLSSSEMSLDISYASLFILDFWKHSLMNLYFDSSLAFYGVDPVGDGGVYYKLQ